MNLDARHWPIPDHWTPEQALAAYDFLSLVRERLWAEYEDRLLVLIIEEEEQQQQDLDQRQYCLDLGVGDSDTE